jgi:hypothetical protein
MPEISDNAAIFIATSFQAYNRAEMGDKATDISNCTVALVFAGFYLEESLDVILSRLKKDDEMRVFFGFKKGKPIGMLLKFAWFYNSYIARSKVSKEKLLRKNKAGKYFILKKLDTKFPGFNRLYSFRNDVAHGKINRFANFRDTQMLRQQAKDMVSQLLEIANQHVDMPIMRRVTYVDAVANFSRMHPTAS